MECDSTEILLLGLSMCFSSSICNNRVSVVKRVLSIEIIGATVPTSLKPALSRALAPYHRSPENASDNFGARVKARAGMEMLAMRTDTPVLTIPRLPNMERGAAAA